jgi:hypothetical protein
VVRGLAVGLYTESIGLTVSDEVRQTVDTLKDMLQPDGEQSASVASVSVTMLAARLGIDKSSATRRVNKAKAAGYIVNTETGRGKAAKLALGEPMPEDREILPSVETVRDTIAGRRPVDAEKCCTVAPESEGINGPLPSVGVTPGSDYHDDEPGDQMVEVVL